MRLLTTTVSTLALCAAAVLTVLAALLPPSAVVDDRELEQEERESLAGQLLIAAPDLDDPYFAGAVIYMLVDDEDGSLGVVLNRARDHEEHQAITLWDGGPVGRDRVFVLHDDLTSPRFDDRSVVVGEVAVAVDPSILEDVMEGQGPRNARVFVGYAGWGPGQLDEERAQGAWFTAPAASSVVLAHAATTARHHCGGVH